MAKSIYNVTPQKDLDLQTARKKMQSTQDVLNERFLRQYKGGTPKEKEEQEAKTELETLLSDFEAQRRTLPVPEGQEAKTSFNPGMRTQVRLGKGAYTAKDGTTLSLADMEIEANRRSAEVDFPLNEGGTALTPRDMFDVEGLAYDAGVGELGMLDTIDSNEQVTFENTAEQMRFNRGANRQLEEGFDPSTQRNNLVDLLASPKSNYGIIAGDVPHMYKRADLDPVGMKNKFHVIKDGTERVKRKVDNLFGREMQLQNPMDQAAIQEMLIKNNVSSRTLTELLYNKIAPANQLMEGNSPNGLGGAIFLATLQHYADAQIASDRRIELLDRYPKDQKELDGWSKDDRQAFENLANEIYKEEMGGQKSIGYLIAQAGNMELTGPEMSILSEIAKKVMVDEFGAEYFTRMPTVLGERVMLTKSMTRWVNEDRNMMMFLLNEPLKLPRVGEAGRIPLDKSKLDHRFKGITNQLTPWLEGQDIEGELNKELHELAIHILNDTPHTTLNTQSRLHAMLMGFNSQTGEYENNTTSSMYDHKEYKNIQYQGEQGNRNRDVEKYDMATGEMRPIRDFSDTEKDTLAQLNLKSAVEYIDNQIRFDHFVGSNFRFYHEASVLNPTNHSARAFLGAGSYIEYKTGSAKDMMKLKAGIMTMVDQKVPGSQVKYEQTWFPARAKAFDENITDWVHRFGDLVEAFSALDGANVPPGLEVEMTRMLQDPDSPLAQASKDLLTFGQEHNGYYSTNAVIEAVKLQLAIEKGSKVYMSNYMFEVDGTSNGLALNALFVAEMEVLAMTGITDFIVNQETGYNYPDQYDEKGNVIVDTSSLNILTAPKPYEMLTQIAVGMLDAASAPAKRALLRIATENGILSDKASKKQITKGSYGSGRTKSRETVEALYTEVINRDPSIEEELFNEGYGQRSEIIRDLAKVNWGALTKITGELRDYGNVQQQFLTEIVEQYTESLQPDGTYDLPPPATTLDGGYILRHGEPVSTIHGPELALPSSLPGSDTQIFRQMTNMIDPEGLKRDKETGKLVGHLSAVTGGPVKMTHHVDAFMVLNYALRAWAENPGAADGVVGGILMQMYDGFFGAPMYADWMDKTLNEEFLNLGWKVNNVSALIDSAERQGYNLKKRRMPKIISELYGFEAKGRKMLANLSKDGIHGNQFQINGGAHLVESHLDTEGYVKGFGFFDSEWATKGIKAIHVSSKSKPILRRTYVQPKGESQEEIEENIKDKQRRIKKRLAANEKHTNQIRVGGYNSRLPKFKVNDKVTWYTVHPDISKVKDGAKSKGVIDRMSIAPSKFNTLPDQIMYVIRMDSGKTMMIHQDRLSKID